MKILGGVFGRTSAVATTVVMTAGLVAGATTTTSAVSASRAPAGVSVGVSAGASADSGSTVAGPAVRLSTGAYRVTGRWSGALRTGSRYAVNKSYWSNYAKSYSVSTGWAGNLLGCLLGWNPRSSQNATLRALNYVRSLNGLAPVSFGSSTMNRRAMATALMMAANNRLSHYPTSSWKCYSRTGDNTAARSNIALAWPKITSGQVIDLYMDDRGRSNTAVGHRRWILNPFSTVMGNASTDTSNALTVIGPSSAYRPNPGWVSWPSKGYFPKPLEPGGRWSLSSGFKSADFRYARVRVYKKGPGRLAVKKYAVRTGYAMPTVVWQMPAERNRTGVYRVIVDHIKRPGHRDLRADYTIRIFNPRN